MIKGQFFRLFEQRQRITQFTSTEGTLTQNRIGYGTRYEAVRFEVFHALLRQVFSQLKLLNIVCGLRLSDYVFGPQLRIVFAPGIGQQLGDLVLSIGG